MGDVQPGDLSALSLLGVFGFSGITLAALVFIALLFSSYVRIATVLSILRAGFGVSALPTAFVTAGLALVLSFFVMYPTLREAGAAVDSVAAGRSGPLSDEDRLLALTKALAVWKKFLLEHTTPEERRRFAMLSLKFDRNDELKQGKGASKDAGEEVAYLTTLEQKATTWQVLAPAFVLSEVRLAFTTGLSLLLPFVVIDLLVAMVMAALSVDTLNAALVALPLKLLLFIAVDGWTLITTNLINTYAA